jgi:O-antigen/teichoic acid export membrane protein
VRNKIFKDTFFLNAASLFKQVLAVLQSIIVMRFLDPGVYGIWLSLNILLTYAGYIHLGLEYGMGNLLPYYKGLNNSERIPEIEDTTYLVWTILAALFMLAVGGYAILAPSNSPVLKLGLVVISVMALLEQQMAFRARWITNALKEFKLFSFLSASRGLVSFVIVVPIAYFWNVEGVILGTLLVSGINTVVWIIKTPYRFRGRISSDAFWETLRIGFPVLLIVLGGGLIETIDRMLILVWFGPVQLGYYSLTAFGGNSLYGFLAQAGAAMSPHIVEEMGRSGDSPEALAKYLVNPTILFAGLIAILIMGLLVIMPFVVEWMVPKYSPGLTAFYLFVPGFFFLSIILSANNILNIYLIARRRQHLAVYIQIASICVELLAGFLFIFLGWGIAGVALASTLAYAFYGLTILNLTAKYVLPDAAIRRSFLFNTMLPFVYALISMIAIIQTGNWLSPHHFGLKLCLQLVLYCLAILPILFLLEKKVGILNYIKPWLDRVTIFSGQA